MRSRKYSGGILVALTAGEQTTVDNDFVGNANFDAAVTQGLTMVIDFDQSPAKRWCGVPLADEDQSSTFDECVLPNEAMCGGAI